MTSKYFIKEIVEEFAEKYDISIEKAEKDLDYMFENYCNEEIKEDQNNV